MTDKELSQEIEWVKEEIEADEYIMDTSDRSDFHAERLEENRERLQDLLDAQGYKEVSGCQQCGCKSPGAEFLCGICGHQAKEVSG